MKQALFEVTLGCKSGEETCDNWQHKKVMAKTASEAIKKIELKSDEFIVAVEFFGRED